MMACKDPENQRRMSREWKKRNPQKVAESTKKWRKENPELFRMSKRKYANKGVAELKDWYVRERITHKNNIKPDEIPASLVVVYRELLKLKRELKKP